jgi:hypothetical protein
MEELDAAMQDLGQALIPGSDLPWWAPRMSEPAIQPSTVTELRLAQRLDSYADHVVGQTREHALFAEARLMDQLFTGQCPDVRGRQSCHRQHRGDRRAQRWRKRAALLPRDIGVDVGGAQVARPTIRGVDARRGDRRPHHDGHRQRRGRRVPARHPTGRADQVGTDHGTQIVYTSTIDANGTSTEMLVVADTSEERFGFRLAPDPRLPRIALEYAAGEAVTTHVWVRAQDGTWHEVVQ